MITSTPVAKTSKRYNLKLPNAVRPLFQEPYDSYLTFLLDLCNNLSDAFPAQLENRLSELPLNTMCSGSRWTLWVGKEIRDRFDERKLILAPSKTHGGFVELMLGYRNQLEEEHRLPVFDKKGYPPMNPGVASMSSSAKTQISKKSKKNSLVSPFLFNQQQLDLNIYPQLFNFGSTMTLNDPNVMEASSYMMTPTYDASAITMMTPTYDASAITMLTPPYDASSEMSLYNPITSAFDFKGHMGAFDFNSQYPSPVYNAADTLNNFDDILNGLGSLPFDPQFFCQTAAVQVESAVTYGDDGVEKLGMQQKDVLPDLGPFYQPVSFHIGDQVHDVPYGYIPNL